MHVQKYTLPAQCPATMKCNYEILIQQKLMLGAWLSDLLWVAIL